ncbi:MAG: Carbon monoxide dehydrogenase [candidate division WS2 bacterium]|nr:Carbon monoxide dehydrogenase [Candidatus Psychracetigena formicireducens]
MSSKKGSENKEIKEVIRYDDTWEPVGYTPMPQITDLRNWDLRLLDTYKPFYAPFCDLCCFCTYGKCDLTGTKKGACGIDIASQQARFVLVSCCMGTAAHAAHGRHLIDYLIDKHGEDYKIDLGQQVDIEAPIIRTVMGLKPQTLGDLRKAIEYVERGLVHAVSATHMGQEGSSLDFESKSLHMGMLDHVALEASDIAQMVGFKFPTSVAETPLVDLGWGSVDKSKPTITCVGHNAIASTVLIDYLRNNNLYDKVEVTGICCTAHDIARYSERGKIIGPLSKQLFFLKTGLADVIITDEQCVRSDIPQLAKEVGSALIATSDKICYGLPEVSKKSVDEIVRMIVDEGKQVLILDSNKVGEVAARVAIEIAPKRKKEILNEEMAQELTKECRNCALCNRVCPNLLDVGTALAETGKGNFELLSRLFDQCIGCGKCEEACPRHIPIIKVMQAGVSWDTYKVRAGRGPVHDVEIRKVGAPIVLGTIPGIVAFVGCSNFPQDIEEIAVMAEEFARRKYIVVLSGCAAMAAGFRKDAEGKTIYEKYPPDFDAGGVLNVGSCVANAHIVGATIKVANIFAKLPIRGNFEVIADYILNRVGACGVAWGAYSQKALAIGTGCNRWGIPVVLGPHASKYRRLYLSDKGDGDWSVIDGREGKVVDTQEPSPEHLAIVIENKERAMVTISKQCIRKNDTPQGRQLKLYHYISLHKNYMGGLPEDLQNFVRNEKDIPIFFKKEVMEHLKAVGWQPRQVLTLPTIIKTYETDVPLDAVIK